MEGVHDRLAFVMDRHKEDPGETEEENQAVEDEEGGESGSSGFVRWPIEPENLGENNKGNRAITCIK